MRKFLTATLIVLASAFSAMAQEATKDANPNGYNADCEPTGAFSLSFPRGYNDKNEAADEALAKKMQERLVTLRFLRGMPTEEYGDIYYGPFPAEISTGNAYIDSLRRSVRTQSFAGITFGKLWEQSTTIKPSPEIDKATQDYIEADLKRLEKDGVDVREAIRVVSFDLRMRYLKTVYEKINKIPGKLMAVRYDAVYKRNYFGPADKLCKWTEQELFNNPEVAILQLMQ